MDFGPNLEENCPRLQKLLVLVGSWAFNPTRLRFKAQAKQHQKGGGASNLWTRKVASPSLSLFFSILIFSMVRPGLRPKQPGPQVFFFWRSHFCLPKSPLLVLNQRFYKVPLDADCSKDKVMQIFGKKLIQISRNLGKMIWWQGKQREKWESINTLLSCVSPSVLTMTSATQKKLFCHQWILTRLCDEKLSSFLKNATKLSYFLHQFLTKEVRLYG